MDDVSRIQHTHTHNYSDFLVVTISVGLTQARSNLVKSRSTHVVHCHVNHAVLYPSVLVVMVKDKYYYTD